MRPCPQTRTADLFDKSIGADNVWTVYFAGSEMETFAPAVENRQVGNDAPTVAETPVIVQRPCRSCGVPFPLSDARRHYCSTECQRVAASASLRRRQAEHRTRFPERETARQALKNAILLGKVRRCSRCEECGERAFTEGHHSDYRRPLFVVWLCRQCHSRLNDGQHFGCGGHAEHLQLSVPESFETPAAHPEQADRHSDIAHQTGSVSHAAQSARLRAVPKGHTGRRS